MPGDKIKVLCVIPARYGSSRFEGKPLAKINDVPMIKRTYDCTIESEVVDSIVATDDYRIFDYCESENINVIMTSDKCLTGTDRVAEVANKTNYQNYDLYVNIQGDEPVIDSMVINQLVEAYSENGNKYIAYNLYKNIDNESDVHSNAIIKVVVNEGNELMYMSRLPVPYSKSGLIPAYKMQIPAYGYTKDALHIFSQFCKTENEKFEDIELLRFLDLGYKLKMIETDATSIAVDFPSDIEKVEGYLRKTGVKYND